MENNCRTDSLPNQEKDTRVLLVLIGRSRTDELRNKKKLAASRKVKWPPDEAPAESGGHLTFLDKTNFFLFLNEILARPNN